MTVNLTAISPHAVMRYLERVLKLTVSPECWQTHDGGRRMMAARQACAAHGLTVDKVAQLILVDAPMIGVMLKARLSQTKIIAGDFAFVIRDGCLVTVIEKWMNDESSKHIGTKSRNRKEDRREAHKTQRRHRKAAKAHLRARLREDA